MLAGPASFFFFPFLSQTPGWLAPFTATLPSKCPHGIRPPCVLSFLRPLPGSQQNVLAGEPPPWPGVFGSSRARVGRERTVRYVYVARASPVVRAERLWKERGSEQIHLCSLSLRSSSAVLLMCRCYRRSHQPLPDLPQPPPPLLPPIPSLALVTRRQMHTAWGRTCAFRCLD
jgi:hypothetical protein